MTQNRSILFYAPAILSLASCEKPIAPVQKDPEVAQLKGQIATLEGRITKLEAKADKAEHDTVYGGVTIADRAVLTAKIEGELLGEIDRLTSNDVIMTSNINDMRARMGLPPMSEKSSPHTKTQSGLPQR